MPVMMRGPIIHPSYDERTYCMPVMMRGHIVCQLCVGRSRETKILMMNFTFFFHLNGFFEVCFFSEVFKARLMSFLS